ncbi:MAG: transcription termination/antitermination protein NusG [Bacillota bacterium]|jgi:transcriptional antiterminator NusG
MGKEWYVIHTYAGYENKVKANLEKRVESMNMEENIFRVIVPMENEVQIKAGKKKITPRKVYPGYVLVEMNLTDSSWYVVRNTPGVTGFVGTGAKPVPLQPEESERILEQMGYMENRIKVNFAVGESVRVIDGPFEDFIGVVEEIYADRGKMKVTVSIFGRETPLELDFSQAEKL